MHLIKPPKEQNPLSDLYGGPWLILYCINILDWYTIIVPGSIAENLGVSIEILVSWCYLLMWKWYTDRVSPPTKKQSPILFSVTKGSTDARWSLCPCTQETAKHMFQVHMELLIFSVELEIAKTKFECSSIMGLGPRMFKYLNQTATYFCPWSDLVSLPVKKRSIVIPCSNVHHSFVSFSPPAFLVKFSRIHDPLTCLKRTVMYVSVSCLCVWPFFFFLFFWGDIDTC